MIDVLFMASTKGELAKYLAARGILLGVGDGQPIFRPGVNWEEYNGGSLITAPRTFRATAPVAIVRASEFAFGATPPWLIAGVTAERQGEVVGTYERNQAGRAVFALSKGAKVQAGDDLDIYTPETRNDLYCAMLRFGDAVADEDDDASIEEELDKENMKGPKARKDAKGDSFWRSKLARYVRSNAKKDDIAGISRWKDNNANVWLLKGDEVREWQRVRGIPTSEWL